MFESLTKNLFATEDQIKDQEVPSNTVATDNTATVAVKKEKQEDEPRSTFQKDGLVLSNSFRLYFSFENPNGESCCALKWSYNSESIFSAIN